MHYNILIVSALIIHCKAIGVATKLDFSEVSIVDSPQTHALANIEALGVDKSKRSDTTGFSGIKCTSGGCNITNPEGSGDSIKTDVVIHVETSLALDTNKTKKVIDETPDVPVVIGYKGTNYDPSPHFGEPNFQSQLIPQSDNGRNMNMAPVIVTNIDNAFPAHIIPKNIYVSRNHQTNRRTDTNIKTLPPIVLNMPDSINGLRYNPNGIQMQIPHFEPSFHSHYYGEHPPPQLAWYPRKPEKFNPVAFYDTPKHTWTPSSSWIKNYPYLNQNGYSISTGRNCPCDNHQNSPGLNYHPRYPTARSDNRRIGASSDPGNQINDKLAPLN